MPWRPRRRERAPHEPLPDRLQPSVRLRRAPRRADPPAAEPRRAGHRPGLPRGADALGRLERRGHGRRQRGAAAGDPPAPAVRARQRGRGAGPPGAAGVLLRLRQRRALAPVPLLPHLHTLRAPFLGELRGGERPLLRRGVPRGAGGGLDLGARLPAAAAPGPAAPPAALGPDRLLPARALPLLRAVPDASLAPGAAGGDAGRRSGGLSHLRLRAPLLQRRAAPAGPRASPRADPAGKPPGEGRRVPDGHRLPALCRRGAAGGGQSRGEAHRPASGRAARDPLGGSSGLQQGHPAAPGGLRAASGALAAVPGAGQAGAHRGALAHPCAPLRGAQAADRGAYRRHQRALRHHRLGPRAVLLPQFPVHGPYRPVCPGGCAPGDPAARRDEPHRQGVPGHAPGPPGRAGAE